MPATGSSFVISSSSHSPWHPLLLNMSQCSPSHVLRIETAFPSQSFLCVLWGFSLLLLYFIQLPLCFASFFSISFLFHLVFLSRSASALSGLPCNSQCKLCCLWSTWSYMTARRFQCKFKLMMLIKFIHQTLTVIVASYIQIHKGLVYIYIYIYSV